jgi:hypothetical protein
MKSRLVKAYWLLIGLLLFPTKIFALDWAVGFDNNGNFSAGVGSNGTLSGRSSGGFLAGGNAYGLPDGSIMGIIVNILNWLLALLGIAGIIGFLISGILYLTSAGDGKQAEKAKAAMMYSIYGIIVGLAGYVIMKAVFAMLNAQSNF